MPDTARIARPRRRLVSRDQIALAALAIIDENGIENCSLNAVADRLRIKAPSFYHHFANRNELLRHTARLLFISMKLPRIESVTDWREEIVRISREAWRSILAHPNAAPLLLEVAPRSILSDAYAYWTRLLGAQGIPPATMRIILDGADKLTYGSALFAAAERRRRGLGPATQAAPDGDEEALFVEALRCFLRGIPSA